jgi:hypothetical protein
MRLYTFLFTQFFLPILDITPPQILTQILSIPISGPLISRQKLVFALSPHYPSPPKFILNSQGNQFLEQNPLKSVAAKRYSSPVFASARNRFKFFLGKDAPMFRF